MLQKQCLAPNTLNLLGALSKFPDLNDFCLVGGTALALHFAHRISIDLDFFTQKEFDENNLLEKLQEQFAVAVTNKSKNTLNLIIDGIKVDMIRYNYPMVKKVVEVEGVRLFSVEDIAAAKLSAITNRGTKKDFFDLYELLKVFSLKELFGFYSIKFKNVSHFMVLKSLTWFDDADEEPDPEMLRPLSWGEVKAFIIKTVKDVE